MVKKRVRENMRKMSRINILEVDLRTFMKKGAWLFLIRNSYQRMKEESPGYQKQAKVMDSRNALNKMGPPLLFRIWIRKLPLGTMSCSI